MVSIIMKKAAVAPLGYQYDRHCDDFVTADFASDWLDL